MLPNWKRFTAAFAVCVAIASCAASAHAQYYQTYYAPSAYQSYYAPGYQSYYAGSAYQSYYAPSTAYYAPSTAYYAPSTAYYAPSTAYYAPAATTAYYSPAPVVYSSGWYPGYWLGRTRTALFGPRTAYVAAYPSTYAAGYSAGYSTVANYAPAVGGCSTCGTYSAGYAPSCSTCGVQQVTLQPACSSCSSCSSCGDCGVPAITQTGYVTTPACSTCSAAQPMSYSNEPTPSGGSTPRTYENSPQQPGLPRNEPTPTERTLNKQPATSDPGTSAERTNLSKEAEDKLLEEAAKREGKTGTNNGASYFEAPKLFDPNDKAAMRSPAPVHTAVYKRPAGTTMDQVPGRVITFEKVQRDAVGWTSSSK